MKPSCESVLRLLRERPDGITSKDAWLELGCSRLAARIADLHAEGHRIESELITVQTGPRKARVARYTLKEDVQLVAGL